MLLSSFLGLAVLITAGLAIRIHKGLVTFASRTRPFPYDLPSCDIDTVTPDLLTKATYVKTSDSGNMGGVFFLALQSDDSSDCMLVVKPRVDLHDVFANTLAQEIGAPLVKAKGFKKADPLYQAIVQGIKIAVNFMDQALTQSTQDEADALVKQFASYVDAGAGYFQIMEKAPGYEPVSALKGLEFQACQICNAVALELKFKELEDAVDVQINKYVTALQENALLPLQRALLQKALGQDGLSENEEEVNRPANVERFRTWVSTSTHRLNPKQFLIKQREMAKREYDCHWRNGAHKQPDEEVQFRKTFLQDSFRTTVKGLADLTAFLTLVGESDNVPTIGYSLVSLASNMRNVMLEPGNARGIDIAVGGALKHNEIRKNGSGSVKADVKTFLIKHWARQGLCNTSSTVAAERTVPTGVQQRWKSSLQMPYFRGEFHGKPKFPASVTSCWYDHGSLFTEEEADSIAASITQHLPAAMWKFLEKLDPAVEKTAARMAGLGGEGMDDIVGWLLTRGALFKEQLEEVAESCSIRLPGPSSPDTFPM